MGNIDKKALAMFNRKSVHNLKPIETYYDGYKFRSKLEARWATFFNEAGIKYEYEKEAYNLGDCYYTPDFWLPELKRWVEVKGQEPTEIETHKLYKLLAMTNQKGFFLIGNTPSFAESVSFYVNDLTCVFNNYIIQYSTQKRVIRECPKCGKTILSFPKYIPPHLCLNNKQSLKISCCRNSIKIANAFIAARQFRHEFK